LKETEIDSLKVLEERIEEKEREFISLKSTLKEIDKSILSDSSELDNLRKEISDLEKLLLDYSNDRSVKQQGIKQNIALRNEYANDIRKIIGTIEVLKKFPKIEDKDTSCPVCEQNIKLSVLKEQFANTDSETIKSELNGLRRRQKELVKIHTKLREDISNYDLEIEREAENLNEMRLQFDNQTKEIVTPFISQRDNITSKLGSIKSDIKNLQHFYKIRNQQTIIDAEIITLENRVTAFKDDLKVLKDSAPSLDRVFRKLGTNLEYFLKFVGMKNVNNISISAKNYLPIIRNRDYEKITSGGVRTLSSVGFYISMLEYAISNSVNYPSLLMIDTIAKYIGKTKETDLPNTSIDEDLKEGMKDGTKYENIYNYLINLSLKSSDSFQIIVVDNDVPKTLEYKLKPFIAKHYTTTPSTISDEIGFIDDAYEYDIVKNKNDEFNDDFDVDPNEDLEMEF